MIFGTFRTILASFFLLSVVIVMVVVPRPRRLRHPAHLQVGQSLTAGTFTVSRDPPGTKLIIMPVVVVLAVLAVRLRVRDPGAQLVLRVELRGLAPCGGLGK